MSAPPSPGVPAHTPPVERRSFLRRQARGGATIRPADKPLAPSVHVILVDISHGGIGVMTTKELVLGEHIIVDITSSAPSVHPHTFEAEVRWTAPGAQRGQYRVGCEWRERLSFADMQRLG